MNWDIQIYRYTGYIGMIQKKMETTIECSGFPNGGPMMKKNRNFLKGASGLHTRISMMTLLEGRVFVNHGSALPSVGPQIYKYDFFGILECRRLLRVDQAHHAPRTRTMNTKLRQRGCQSVYHHQKTKGLGESTPFVCI